MKRIMTGIAVIVMAMAAMGAGQEPDRVKVVGSVPDFAAIAKEIGGDLVEVSWIARGNQDPHFVLPKPSYAQMLSDADLFITTGIDLEMWAPPLIDKSRNPNILEGAQGYVAATAGLDLLGVPTHGVDRSAGDIHVYGNPHIQTCPVRLIEAANNIKIGLQKVDPDNEEAYEEGYRSFTTRMRQAMFGEELMEIVGGDLLCELAIAGSLIGFLDSEQYNGGTLLDLLGGWMREAMPFRGMKIIAYHKNWEYFADLFGMRIIEFVEPKPGIPPTARHVKKVIDDIERHEIEIMLVANYFEKNTPRRIEERTGVRAIFLPISVTGEPGIDTIFELYDYWIETINNALAGN